MATQIGKINEKVIKALNLQVMIDTPIYIGESNINHMKSSHPADYSKYGNDIAKIISAPDYVGINKSDNSIEYVKEYYVGTEFVKVAVRVSKQNVFFVRSLYVLNKSRVNSFIKKGTLKALD